VLKKTGELRALQGYLQMFETEISFMSNVLKDAFTKIYMYDDSSVAVFFKGTVEALKTIRNNCRRSLGQSRQGKYKEHIFEQRGRGNNYFLRKNARKLRRRRTDKEHPAHH